MRKILFMLCLVGVLFLVSSCYGAYTIRIIYNGTGGDVTKNYYINKYMPSAPVAKNVVEASKKGTPMFILGNKSNRRVMIVAGVHGNELPASIAAIKLIDYISRKNINGMVYVIPFVVPASTQNSIRYWNGKNLNEVANVRGTPTNVIFNIIKSSKINTLGDFHSTRPGGNPGRTCIFSSKSPTMESYRMAVYISGNVGCPVIAYDRAGVEYPGALEDVCNLAGIAAVTCEVLCPHATATSTSIDASYRQMIALLKYKGIIGDPPGQTAPLWVAPRDILKSAKSLRNYINTYRRIPSSVTVTDKTLTIEQFTYLMTECMIRLRMGSYNSIQVLNVSKAPNPITGKVKGALTISQYLQVTGNVKNFIKIYHRLPNYISTQLGGISPRQFIDIAARILGFYADYNRLPNYAMVRLI